jgi:hypothetical protein
MLLFVFGSKAANNKQEQITKKLISLSALLAPTALTEKPVLVFLLFKHRRCLNNNCCCCGVAKGHTTTRTNKQQNK